MSKCLLPWKALRRAGTGPPGTAGLPKQKKFCGPVVYIDTGLFYDVLKKYELEART